LAPVPAIGLRLVIAMSVGHIGPDGEVAEWRKARMSYGRLTATLLHGMLG
jgi:hypothetical protein